MGIELALGLEECFGIRLPAMMLNESPTTERVSMRIVEKIMRPQEESAPGQGGHLEALVNFMAMQHDEVISTADMEQTVAEIESYLKTGTERRP
jgi:hypothetical protein